jgi:4-oxalocrotonate tautomerase
MSASGREADAVDRQASPTSVENDPQQTSYPQCPLSEGTSGNPTAAYGRSRVSQGFLKNKSLLSESLDRLPWVHFGIPRFKRGLHIGDKAMPQIDVHLIKNVFNAEQKKQIIEKLTDAMVSVEGENMRGVTWVKIFEVNSGDWGIGGQPLTTEAVKELAAGRRAA